MVLSETKSALVIKIYQRYCLLDLIFHLYEFPFFKSKSCDKMIIKDHYVNIFTDLPIMYPPKFHMSSDVKLYIDMLL